MELLQFCTKPSIYNITLSVKYLTISKVNGIQWTVSISIASYSYHNLIWYKRSSPTSLCSVVIYFRGVSFPGNYRAAALHKVRLRSHRISPFRRWYHIGHDAPIKACRVHSVKLIHTGIEAKWSLFWRHHFKLSFANEYSVGWIPLPLKVGPNIQLTMRQYWCW